MGVQRLWDLLSAAARPVRVESLRGKKCAIDAGYWISLCLASESNVRHGSDIIGVFFLRICYLLEKGIKPIFVFDGRPPDVKQRVLLKRKLIHEKKQVNHNLMAFRLLRGHLKRFINSSIKAESERNDLIKLPRKVTLDPLLTTISNKNCEDNVTKSNLAPFCIDGSIEDGLFGSTQVISTNNENKSKNIFTGRTELCNYNTLSNSEKYSLMNKVKDEYCCEDRAKSLELKGSMSEYSDFQLNSYFREIVINQEIERLRSEISVQTHGVKVKKEVKQLVSNYDYYDYNNYAGCEKKRRFLNNLNINMKPSIQSTTKYDLTLDNSDKNEYIDPTIFLSDEQIFGGEFNTENGQEKASKSNNRQEFFQNSLLCSENYVNKLVIGENCSDLSFNDASKFDCNILDNGKHSNEYIVENDDYETIDSIGDIVVDHDINTLLVDYPIDCSINNEVLDSLEDAESYHEYLDIRNKAGESGKLCKLLDLFGIPFMTAPSESESQCAYLNRSGVCYAVITDDSDALVFGANRVVKNFYNANAFELYTSDNILSKLGLTQIQLALIAVICGCDYTAGVHGIGIVNALEVIKAYPSFNDLYEFRKWATSDCDLEAVTQDSCPIRREFKQAHINYRIHWFFSVDFPNKEAYNTFLNPPTTSRYCVSWRFPKTDEILLFMENNSSLPFTEVKECLDSLTKKKMHQLIIEDLAPEIYINDTPITSLKNIRNTLRRNLSAFRKIIRDLGSKNKQKIVCVEANLSTFRPDHIHGKISSKRIQNSIQYLKKHVAKLNLK